MHAVVLLRSPSPGPSPSFRCQVHTACVSFNTSSSPAARSGEVPAECIRKPKHQSGPHEMCSAVDFDSNARMQHTRWHLGAFILSATGGAAAASLRTVAKGLLPEGRPAGL